MLAQIVDCARRYRETGSLEDEAELCRLFLRFMWYYEHRYRIQESLGLELVKRIRMFRVRTEVPLENVIYFVTSDLRDRARNWLHTERLRARKEMKWPGDYWRKWNKSKSSWIREALTSERFTDEERTVVEKMLEGWKYREIADALGLSLRGVSDMVGVIIFKMKLEVKYE